MCTGIGSLGTSVATETCGHERPLKFSSTVWLYWIWVQLTVNDVLLVMACDGVTRNVGTGAPAAELPATEAGAAGAHGGTVIFSETVSIQKVAVSSTSRCASGRPAPLAPSTAQTLSPQLIRIHGPDPAHLLIWP